MKKIFSTLLCLSLFAASSAEANDCDVVALQVVNQTGRLAKGIVGELHRRGPNEYGIVLDHDIDLSEGKIPAGVYEEGDDVEGRISWKRDCNEGIYFDVRAFDNTWDGEYQGTDLKLYLQCSVDSLGSKRYLIAEGQCLRMEKGKTIR